MYYILAHRIRISEILPWDRKSFLAHRIRISEILPWDRKSFLAHRIQISEILPWDRNLILPMLSYPGCHVRATYIGHTHGRQVTSLLC